METKRLIEVACGRRAADYYLANGMIVNARSGEVLEGNVAISGERIAWEGPSDTMVGSGTKVVDVGGDYLIPGFFDPHTHADLLFNPASEGPSDLHHNVRYPRHKYSPLGFSQSPHCHSAHDRERP